MGYCTQDFCGRAEEACLLPQGEVAEFWPVFGQGYIVMRAVVPGTLRRRAARREELRNFYWIDACLLTFIS